MCLPETHRLAHAVTTSSAVDDEVEATDGIDFHHPRNRLSIWLDNLEKERTRRDYRQPVSGGTKCRSPCDIFDRATTDEATQVKVVQRTTHHLVEEVEDQAWLMEIMAVDKDEAQLMILKKIFKGMLFVQLTHAGSAEEALSLLADRYDNKGSVISSFPALVVMDMDTVVTGMSGLDATRKIRKFYPDIPLPIILSTAKDDFETLRLCFEAGGNDLITKPFTSDVLMARISAQLGLLDRWSNQLSLQRKVQLLHDILPEEVVERLSHGEHMVSEELEEVSIVFTDIVGYTSLASSVHTVSLMAMLHQLFRSFDQLTEKHRVYKVETIGGL